MLPVYICEDNEIQLAHLKKMLQNIILMEATDASVVYATPDPDTLLSYLSDHRAPSVYFLDINLNGKMNGFLLAQEIRNYDPRGFIVYVTTHSELSSLAYKYRVEAMDYIIKDNTKEFADRVKDCLIKAITLYTLPTNTVQEAVGLHIDGRAVSIKLAEIYCVETTGEAHKIRICKKSGYTELFYSLKEIKKLTNDSFFQSHKSCIVNLKYVKEIRRQDHTVMLENGKICPVSTRLFKDLSQVLHYYSQLRRS